MHLDRTRAAKTIEVDKLRFTDKDLTVIGTLEYGQFSTVCTLCHLRTRTTRELTFIPQIDVVNCNVDGRVYVRKSIEKRFALKTREVRFVPPRKIQLKITFLFVCSNATPS